MGHERVWPAGVGFQGDVTSAKLDQLDIAVTRCLTYWDLKAQNWDHRSGPVSAPRVVDRVASWDPVNRRLLAFGNGAAANGAIWWSPNGESMALASPAYGWTQASVTGPAGHAPTFSWLETNPAGVTLAGGDMSGSTTDNVIQRSVNGHDFPHQSLPGGWTGTKCGIWDATNALWIVAGMAAGEIATSPDGITWTVRVVPAPASGDIFVACDVDPTGKSYFQGDAGHGARSDNGTVWTSVNNIMAAPKACRYNPSDDLWMAIGAGQVRTSADRTTWADAGSGHLFDFLDLAYDGRLWVAAAGHSVAATFSGAAYSVDRGANWNFVPLGNADSDARGIRHLRNTFWLAAPDNTNDLSQLYRSLRIGVDAFNNEA